MAVGTGGGFYRGHVCNKRPQSHRLETTGRFSQLYGTPSPANMAEPDPSRPGVVCQ